MTAAVIFVRDERATDFTAISAVTVAAFASLEISSHTEQFIVAALRSAGALAVSLVAEVDGRVVGHIVGHPQYYRRFGFENAAGMCHEGVPDEFFFALAFDGPIPQGQVLFHEAFKAKG